MYNHEELEAIVSQLIAKGWVTQEQIDASLAGHSSKEKRDIADLMHTLYCEMEHVAEEVWRQEALRIVVTEFTGEHIYCYFYTEELLEGCWSRPYHRKWLDKVDSLREALCRSDSLELFLADLTEAAELLSSTDHDVIALAAAGFMGLEVILASCQNLAGGGEPNDLEAHEEELPDSPVDPVG
jgi:hypothetical protein